MTDPIAFNGHTLCSSPSELGEGPTYDPGSGTAWWFNIKGRELHELHIESGRKQVHALPFLGSVLAVIDPLRQLIASDEGLYVRDTQTGTLSPFCKIEDVTANRSNDGRVHASGSLWIGTMGRKAEKHSGSIYHVSGTTVTRLFGNITIPNSICFSPDGATAYFVDTDVNHLMRVDIDPQTGLPTGEPALLNDQSNRPGGVDGSICDADGLIWNARWDGSSVDVYTPDGAMIRRHAVPARQASCPAFIGPKADRILVTTAWQDMDKDARNADPAAGHTFDLGVAVNGRFEPCFRL